MVVVPLLTQNRVFYGMKFAIMLLLFVFWASVMCWSPPRSNQQYQSLIYCRLECLISSGFGANTHRLNFYPAYNNKDTKLHHKNTSPQLLLSMNMRRLVSSYTARHYCCKTIITKDIAIRPLVITGQYQQRQLSNDIHHTNTNLTLPLYKSTNVGRPPTHQSIIETNKQYLITKLNFTTQHFNKSMIRNLLTLNIGTLHNRVIWLQSRLQLSTVEIQRIAQLQPGILTRQSNKNYYYPNKKSSNEGDNDPFPLALSPKLNILQQRLQLDDLSLKKLIVRTPSILMASLDGNLEPKLNYLQRKLSLDDDTSLRKFVLTCPSVLACSIEENIEVKLDWLQERLILDEKRLTKLIISFPNVITISIHDNIEPTLDWLQHRLSLTNEQLSKVIQKRPSILSLSITDNIEPTLDWLQQRLQLNDTALSKLIQQMPPILGLSMSDNIEPKLDWIQNRLSLTDEQLTKMIQRYPALLTCSIDSNIEPTLNFYIDALGGDKNEAITFVISNPSSFGRSLEKRLKPRLEEAQKAGIDVDSKLLYQLIFYTKDKWNGRIELQKGINISHRQSHPSCASPLHSTPRIGSGGQRRPFTTNTTVTTTDQSIVETNRQYMMNTLGFSDQKLDKIEASASNILTLDIGTLDKRVQWLKKRLNLTNNEVKKLIHSQSTILGRQTESDNGMESKLDWLQKRLHLDDTALNRMIQRMPKLLSYSTPNKIEPTLDWLQQRLDLNDVALSKMILLNPSILGNSISDNMEPKLEWLQHRLSLTDAELSDMIQKQPALFGYNIPNNLEPTLDFYIDALGSKSDAITYVRQKPKAFSYSLEKRLKPRLKQALDVGMVVNAKLMNLINSYTNEQWDKKIAKEGGE